MLHHHVPCHAGQRNCGHLPHPTGGHRRQHDHHHTRWYDALDVLCFRFPSRISFVCMRGWRLPTRCVLPYTYRNTLATLPKLMKVLGMMMQGLRSSATMLPLPRLFRCAPT